MLLYAEYFLIGSFEAILTSQKRFLANIHISISTFRLFKEIGRTPRLNVFVSMIFFLGIFFVEWITDTIIFFNPVGVDIFYLPLVGLVIVLAMNRYLLCLILGIQQVFLAGGDCFASLIFFSSTL